MKETKIKLEYNKILEMLKEQAVSNKAKTQIENLEIELEELKLKRRLTETTEARKILDAIGLPPLSEMQNIEELLSRALEGYYLLPEQLLSVAVFLASCQRMEKYLTRARYLETGLSHYAESICPCTDIRERIEESIRGNQVEDGASPALKGIRREIMDTQEKIKEKLEQMLRSKKECLADSFLVQRNGRWVLPVKKECKGQIEGTVLDKSASGNTLFMEPRAVGRLQERLTGLAIEEENEVMRILYELTDDVLVMREDLVKNMELMEQLDFAFAKGKLSQQMKAREVPITVERELAIKGGRHPLLPEDQCVPLDFQMGNGLRGVVVTGPNTGGKTVALKTVGLLSLMIQCGLHVPVEEGSRFSIHNLILCDIGDGQNMEQNLSTFSAHINRMNAILGAMSRESLVLLDELGSGTDPAEGMGIAIAMLEALRQKGCLFVATTHYPEVKEYAENAQGLVNARMLFDKESLKPLYCMEIGVAGESCALYIADKLGFPKELITLAEHYVNHGAGPVKENEKHYLLQSEKELAFLKKGDQGPKVKAVNKKKKPEKIPFAMGDSVMVYPRQEKGIVFEAADENGEVGVQIKGQKKKVFHKRLRLLVKASQLYPEEYDFSILFDTKKNRKAKKIMAKRHDPDAKAVYDSLNP